MSFMLVEVVVALNLVQEVEELQVVLAVAALVLKETFNLQHLVHKTLVGAVEVLEVVPETLVMAARVL
jgi:hypothetical protein